MARPNSSARLLDFEGSPAATPVYGVARVGLHATSPITLRRRPGRRVALPEGATRRLLGPDKYKVLERRRRQAQIAARRVLDLIDVMEHGGRGEAATLKEGK
jgi:hypothetical protein